MQLASSNPGLKNAIRSALRLTIVRRLLPMRCGRTSCMSAAAINPQILPVIHTGPSGMTKLASTETKAFSTTLAHTKP